jgi:DNA-directed RNA polymerase specialized sigma24 family protein
VITDTKTVQLRDGIPLPALYCPDAATAKRVLEFFTDMLQRLLEHGSAFRVFLRRRVGDEAVVDDLLQQIMIRAVQSHHSIRSNESVVAWFYKILRHTLIDYYRSKGTEARRTPIRRANLTIQPKE